MDTFFDAIVEAAPQFPSVLSYVGVCALLLLSGMGVPLPEDITLLAAGVLCQQELTDLGIMLVLTFLFVVGADLVLFYLGRRYGQHVPRLPLLRHYLTTTRTARAEKFFNDHGGKTLFVARFLPGIRAAVWFSAGACRIPFWKMLTYDGIAALLSVPTFVLAGYYGAQQIDGVKQWTTMGKIGLAVLILVTIGSIIVYQVIRRKKVAAKG